MNTTYQKELLSMKIVDLDTTIERESAELFAGIIRDEAATLTALLPQAFDRQWERSPVPRPRDSEGRKTTAERPDPTADAALDTRRLRLRSTTVAAVKELQDAAVSIRAARLSLGRALDRFDGLG